MNSRMISAIEKQFKAYKAVADEALLQLEEDALLYNFDGTGNSIGVLVKHISGNMKSRFSDFLTTDGEKSWRDKPGEFVNEIPSKAALLRLWEEAWHALFSTLKLLTDADLEKHVFLKGKEITVANAILRQLTHYSYHIGQIVYAAKLIKKNEWKPVT